MDLLTDGRFAGGGASGGLDDSLGLASVLDELAHGIVVTTIEGRVIHANQAAQNELMRRRVLATRQRVLHGTMPEGAKLLREALLRVTEGKRSLIALPAAQGPGLTLVAIPVKPQGPRRPLQAALLFARTAVCDPLMLGFFARSRGLTATEEQVLGILCEGFSAPEIAVEMNVAVSTVRSHVRSLCAKTESSGVRELVGRLAVLPPVTPLPGQPIH